MERLLRLSEPPTAVFATSDEMVMAAVHVARRTGLRLPLLTTIADPAAPRP